VAYICSVTPVCIVVNIYNRLVLYRPGRAHDCTAICTYNGYKPNAQLKACFNQGWKKRRFLQKVLGF